MFERLDQDARQAIMVAAKDEARRRADRRIGTDHLLLGLLRDPASFASRALGIDLQSARAAGDALDRAALAAVGIDLDDHTLSTPMQVRSHAPFTSGARAVLKLSLDQARRSKSRRIQPRHLLLALLTRQRPDPAAVLLEALGVDAAQAHDRLSEPGA